jgi:hypothetical protein
VPSSNPDDLAFMVGVPTLSRADLLNCGYSEFARDVRGNDHLVVLDNGAQTIDIPSSSAVEIVRVSSNIGVAPSWNYFLRRAFVDGSYDGLVILGDDVVWSCERLRAAKHLLFEWPDVDLFLSYSFFDVQVHRPENIQRIGFYDETFSPAWCEDDDYALRMICLRRIYQRFHELDPLPGTQREATSKPIPYSEARRKFVAKWPHASWFAVNHVQCQYYETSRIVDGCGSSKSIVAGLE